MVSLNWIGKVCYSSLIMFMSANLLTLVLVDCHGKDKYKCGLLIPSVISEIENLNLKVFSKLILRHLQIFPFVNMYEQPIRDLINIFSSLSIAYFYGSAMNGIFGIMHLKESVSLHYAEIIDEIRELKLIKNPKLRYNHLIYIVDASMHIQE